MGYLGILMTFQVLCYDMLTNQVFAEGIKAKEATLKGINFLLLKYFDNYFISL